MAIATIFRWAALLVLGGSVAMAASQETASVVHFPPASLNGSFITTDGSAKLGHLMDYKDVPLEGYIQHYMGVHTRFTVFDWHSTDRRDRSSLYMCTTRQTWKYTRFKMYAYTAIDGAFLIQIADVQEDNGKKAEGWFLGVHDAFSSDRMGGFARVIAHSDVNKAGVWRFESQRSKTGIAIRILRLVGNLEGSKVGLGNPLVVIKDRDWDSDWIGVAIGDDHHDDIGQDLEIV